MWQSKWRHRLACGVGSLVVTAVVVVPAHADPEPPPGPSVAMHEAATTPEAAAETTKFWTPDRMRDAVPMEQLVANLPPGQGVPQAWQTPEAAQALPAKGDPWSTGGEVVKTTGRVFFSYKGKQASCSGSAVNSANKSVVITAGHCVRMDGNWHPDWVFVPAYDNGNTPHGTWTAKQLLATPQWVEKEELNFDVGAAVINQLEGKNLTDVVGGQDVLFNQPRNQVMYAFGYPAAAPFDGTRLIYCSGTSFNDFLLSKDHGLQCNQTGGSSGGPWFVRFDEATGKGAVNSVNSFKYGLISFLMFGPYFGNEAQAVFDAAQKA